MYNGGKTCALYGYSPEIRNLPCVTSRLISELDREYAEGLWLDSRERRPCHDIETPREELSQFYDVF